jgi:hypothetical protein
VHIFYCLAEILEYALVFMASALVVVFSFGMYSTYSSAVAESEYRVGFSSLVSVAMASVEHGGSAITLHLDNVTLECQAGHFNFVSPTYSASASLPAECNFKETRISGTRTFIFSDVGGSIGLEVR